MIKVEEKDDEKEEKKIVRGFMLVPVFRMEDTDGKPLEYPELNIPEFPFIERAKEWGINVTAVSGNSYYYGAYSQTRKEIVLASPEESVFFHELCHSAHHRINGLLKAGQDWKQEVVAELGAIVLCKLMGKEPDKALGNGYSYISNYAEKAQLSPLTAVVKVLSETEKVLNLILKGGDTHGIQHAI
jgi:antirestriction protein ArdC